MKSVIFLASSLSALASASAVKPFQLVVESADQSINGDYLWPCHSGESTSRFCLGGDGKDLWTFTEAKGAEQSVADYTAPGYLTWVGGKLSPLRSSSLFWKYPRVGSTVSLC